MTKNNDPITILMADDDDDDYLLTKKALKENNLINELVHVRDGEQLLHYLRGEGEYAEAKPPRPGVVLLDLNMPRMDGREALKAIKSDPTLNGIPIVIFTTSKAEEDVYRSYQLGSNSFITKPVTFENLIKVMKTIGSYWFEIVALPNGNELRKK